GVGAVFSGKLLDETHARLAARTRPTPGFGGAVPTGRGHAGVEPEMVVEVRYKERTGEGLLRHPAFLRVRDDKTVQECVRDDEPESDHEPPPEAAPPAAWEPAEKVVPFSNLTKVFWP